MSNGQPETFVSSAIWWIIIFGIIGVIFHYFAKRRSLFSLDPTDWERPHWRLWQVGVLFLIYIFVSSLVAPICIWLITKSGTVLRAGARSAVQQWITVGGTGFLFWLFSITLAKGCAKVAWQGGKKNTIRSDLGYGILFWILSLPFVIATMYLFELLTYFAFGSFGVEQTSVLYLRESMAEPFFFGTALVAIIIGAPFIEEFLFRGCLQGWMRNHIGSKLSIVITSVVFALFHYAPRQKMGNIPIVASLFVLSLYLGWVYEKRRSLWSPIALHLVFNASSVVYILTNLGAAQ